MPATLFPGANTTAQWFGNTKYALPMGPIEKIVLHTTEVDGWPGYSDGSVAPHLTWRYVPGAGRDIRQHFRFSQIGRALQNLAGGVQTNADGCIQIELVGTCDPTYANGGKGLYWPAAPDVVLELLAVDLSWLCSEFGLPRTFVPTWLPYPRSYGNSAARLTGAQFNAFRGILGHQHVPENEHGDPGALNVAKLKQYMPSAAPGAPTRQFEEDVDVTKDEVVQALIEAVNPAGTPSFGEYLDARIYKQVQTALLDAADPTKTPDFLRHIREALREELQSLPPGTGAVNVDANPDAIADRVLARIRSVWTGPA